MYNILYDNCVPGQVPCGNVPIPCRSICNWYTLTPWCGGRTGHRRKHGEPSSRDRYASTPNLVRPETRRTSRSRFWSYVRAISTTPFGAPTDALEFLVGTAAVLTRPCGWRIPKCLAIRHAQVRSACERTGRILCCSMLTPTPGLHRPDQVPRLMRPEPRRRLGPRAAVLALP